MSETIVTLHKDPLVHFGSLEDGDWFTHDGLLHQKGRLPAQGRAHTRGAWCPDKGEYVNLHRDWKVTPVRKVRLEAWEGKKPVVIDKGNPDT